MGHTLVSACSAKQVSVGHRVGANPREGASTSQRVSDHSLYDPTHIVAAIVGSGPAHA